MRQITPRPNRPASRAGYKLHNPEPQGLHAPGTPGFLYWQCREAAHAALAAWESHDGALSRWQAARRIDLWQNAVAQLGESAEPNAFYDRAGFEFFEFTVGGQTTFSGESTDVVAHEIGHGLLDAFRPDFWGTAFLEVGAFHEAFGDCVALLTALADPATRTALVSRINVKNFVETTAEDLSDCIRRWDPSHNAAQPRHALNKLKWVLPSTLPADGGPGVLINEEHSFARIFTGCFYDLFRRLVAGPATGAALEAAARKTAKLLIAGARTAPETARFFQAVGRAMTLADQDQNGGANRDTIRLAFEGHDIALGTNAMLAPFAALPGPTPRISPRAAILGAATSRALAIRFGAGTGARMLVRSVEVAGRRIAQAIQRREVPLAQLHPKLKGAVAMVTESVLVGVSGGRAAALGALPDPSTSTEEVLSYVGSLVRNHRIDFDSTQAARGERTHYTHALRSVRGKRTLARLRFSCRR
jgi:hypothetical protein